MSSNRMGNMREAVMCALIRDFSRGRKMTSCLFLQWLNTIRINLHIQTYMSPILVRNQCYQLCHWQVGAVAVHRTNKNDAVHHISKLLGIKSFWHVSGPWQHALSRRIPPPGVPACNKSGLQHWLCFYAFPWRTLWLLWLPCFLDCLLRFHPGFRSPAQSSDYSWAPDGLGWGCVNECHYILMKPIGCSLFVFHFLKSLGAWLKP